MIWSYSTRCKCDFKTLKGIKKGEANKCFMSDILNVSLEQSISF